MAGATRGAHGIGFAARASILDEYSVLRTPGDEWIRDVRFPKATFLASVSLSLAFTRSLLLPKNRVIATEFGRENRIDPPGSRATTSGCR